ncbi:LOW QUALITY PROTEIN: schlafen family member 11-like [Rhynochetos jubatus]
MARQEGLLLVNLKTNYPDVVVDIEKIILGERSRKKTSCIQKRQCKELSTAACALLNSGGGVVRIESADKNYCFQEDGIGLDIEQSLRECIDCTETIVWMQQQSHLLLFVKTWSCGGPEQESTSTKPICSLSTGLSRRSFTSVVSMTSSDAAGFLRRKESCAKHRDENGPSAVKAPLIFGGGARETPLNTEECNIQEAAARFLRRDKLTAGEVVDFTETTHIEFKNFSTENILAHIRKTLPNYASAFADTQGGYLFFGVDNTSKVIGSHSKVKKEDLEKTVAATMGSMHFHHFCSLQAGMQFKTYVLSVYDKEECLQGCVCVVCVVRVEEFCCAVFHDNPESWIVKGEVIERLSIRKWTELMTAVDPDLSNLAHKFQNELSLSNGPPLIKPVYSKAGLPCVSELQECLYSVDSNEVRWKPETICTDLFSEYPGLEDLMKKQICGFNKGILIFSRSWAVDIGLQRKEDVVCDVLLVAENVYPILYIVVKDASSAEFESPRETASALKQKQVNDGGFASKLCVIPQVLHLNGTKNQMDIAEDGLPQQENPCDYPSLYPENYMLTSSDIPAFLRALVIVVLHFKSYLSDNHLGCEIFNLLTLKQYKLLSKNLHKTKEQFVLGLPGTWKTTVGLKIIERVRDIFHSSAEEMILYICENQPLKKFVGNETCQAVTRVVFLNGSFPEVKHIIVVDEPQNFRSEGNWYQCAWELVKKKGGIFWVFLDFFQSTHPYGCGLKFSELCPQEWLTEVVRNAKQIYNVIFNLLEKILQERNTDMPYEVLEKLFKEAKCAYSLSGDYVIKENMETFEMAEYVTRQCSTQHAAQAFSQMLEPELRRQVRKHRVRLVLGSAEAVSENVIILDSIRRFSGLERRIVFGIHPVPAQEEIALNLLLCLASRANTKLHLLYHKEKTFLGDTDNSSTMDTTDITTCREQIAENGNCRMKSAIGNYLGESQNALETSLALLASPHRTGKLPYWGSSPFIIFVAIDGLSLVWPCLSCTGEAQKWTQCYKCDLTGAE